MTRSPETAAIFMPEKPNTDTKQKDVRIELEPLRLRPKAKLADEQEGGEQPTN